MKIVSLLPSATEICYALGLEEEVVAVTHECDFPLEAKQKPVITSSVLDHTHSSSLSIHKGVTGLVHEGKSIYHLDETLLAELNPDLILTQELCEVCAVSYNVVQKAAKILQGEREIISLEPNTIWDILENIRLVGEKTDKAKEANELVASFEQRIEAVRKKTADIEQRPRVYCMEWLNPPFVAGHWIFEMVEIAGGQEGLARAGKPSVQIKWQEVVEFAPEILIFMPCGFDLKGAITESQQLTEYPGWSSIPAVESDTVFAVDGSSYFNRPGPRIVDGLEIFAQIIHPEMFSYSHPAAAFRKLNEIAT